MIRVLVPYFKGTSATPKGNIMLAILADTFRTATRTENMRVYDAPDKAPRKRWLPEGHWFVKPQRDTDPTEL